MVKIRLKKLGAKKNPCYRIVIQDSRKPRNGTCIEEVGYYHPKASEADQISMNVDRIGYWIGVGAQPTDTVKKLINKNSKAE